MPRATHYQRLARFRYALRRFLRFSEDAARDVGISPGQYQLLLFIRSARGTLPSSPTLPRSSRFGTRAPSA